MLRNVTLLMSARYGMIGGILCRGGLFGFVAPTSPATPAENLIGSAFLWGCHAGFDRNIWISAGRFEQDTFLPTEMVEANRLGVKTVLGGFQVYYAREQVLLQQPPP